MKKILISVIAIVAVLIVGCTQKEIDKLRESLQLTNMETYHSEKMSMSISVPKNWEKKYEGTALFIEPSFSNNVKSFIHVSDADGIEFKDLDVLMESQIDSLALIMADMVETASGDTEVGPYLAKVRVLSGDITNKPRVVHVYSILHNQKIYSITFMFYKPVWESIVSNLVLDRMLKTIDLDD